MTFSVVGFVKCGPVIRAESTVNRSRSRCNRVTVVQLAIVLRHASPTSSTVSSSKTSTASHGGVESNRRPNW